MDIIVFDLDNTLVNTNSCQYYLRSQAGRDVISEFIATDKVKTSLYDDKVVDWFNELVERDFVIVLVVSDSPKDYCISVLRKHGFKIDDDHVFGSQGKPCVDFDEVLNSLSDTHGKFFFDDPVLVVGDSPKDIFFGYHIKAPTVFATWGTRFRVSYVVDNSLPEKVAEDFESLEKSVELFLNGELLFEEKNFSQHFLTVRDTEVELFEFPEEDVGHGREYVPDFEEFRNKYDRYVWFDVNRSIKKAKFLTPAELQANTKLKFYSHTNGVTRANGFKTNAGHYIQDFKRWLGSRGVEGKIALVPMPSSLPRECNLSNVMEILCSWWAAWINQEPALPYTAFVWDCLERFEPTVSSHTIPGVRTMDRHLNTIGLFKHEMEELPEDTAAIVLIDDVWTSGTQMNSSATILKHHGFVPESVELLAFTLVKTTHPNPFGEVDFEEILRIFDSAQKKSD